MWKNFTVITLWKPGQVGTKSKQGGSQKLINSGLYPLCHEYNETSSNQALHWIKVPIVSKFLDKRAILAYVDISSLTITASSFNKSTAGENTGSEHLCKQAAGEIF